MNPVTFGSPLRAAPPSNIRRKRAFTLIELLTVIAIIVILAAILIVSIGKIKESANKSVSIGRQHDLATLFQLYANDNKGTFPNSAGPKSSFSGGRWPFYLADYIPPFQTTHAAAGYVNNIVGDWNVFRQLPVFHDPTNFDPTADAALGIWGYNANLSDLAAPVKMITLSNPAAFPVLTNSQPDISGLHLIYGGPSPLATQRGWNGKTTTQGPAPLYGRKAIFLFADWHVAAIDVCAPNAWPWNDPLAFTVR